MGDYQGSQAFAQTSGGAETVNRSTGSLNYSIPLIELRGVVKAIDLTLSLTYTAGISGNFGLPQNWTFGIAYVIPGQSVTTQGRTYVIDPDWSDANGYHSGLRYINNHGMLFAEESSTPPLPSGLPGQYAWSFRYTDGAIDYFDAQGKLLEHDDIHGNFIYYSYMDPESTPQTALLEFIQDSWQQQVTFNYEPGDAIYLTGPNNDQITISYGDDGISQVELPGDLVVSFNYFQVASRTVIQAIQLSTGLQSVFNYQTLAYLDSSNQQQQLPAVQDHVHLDANGNLLSQTTYQYGTASSGQTFTGYAIQAQMGSGSDGLIDSGNSAYEYDVLILNIDANGTTLSASQITYNYLHLPVVEDHYAIDNGGNPVNAFRAINTYIIDPSKHAQTPNYTSPAVVEHFNWNPTSQQWQQLRLAKSTSDDYGCVTYSDQSIWDTSKATYVLQQSKSSTYVATSWGGEMLNNETYEDAITGFGKQIAYGLTSDQKNIASLTTSFRPSLDSQFVSWKVKKSTYDDNGRVLTETVAWSDPASALHGSVQAYTNSNEYAFDSSQNSLTVNAIDPSGKATISRYATNVRKGPLLEKVLPLGQKETFTYDDLGRQVSHTDSLGNTTTLTYTISQAENSVSSVASNGYRLKYILDALGRHIQLLDNGGPSSTPGSDPTRVLYTKSYDSLSRITTRTDATGLVTKYTAYDAFNQILSITDSDGNVITNTYDNVDLKITSSINGSLRVVTQLDKYSRKIATSKYADTSDTSIDYKLTETYKYDGFGKVYQIDHYKDALDNSTTLLLDTTSRTFDVEDNIQQETLKSKSDVNPDSYDTVHRDFIRDIFGLICTHTKTTSYSDGRVFVQPGTVDIYDECKLHVQHRNQLGQVETYGYDDNGWKTSMTRLDGGVVNYLRDDVGRLTAIKDGTDVETRTYLPNDRLASMSTTQQGQPVSDSVEYAYTVDGSVTTVTYPNAQTNLYGLDEFGRIVTQTDVNNVQRKIVFNEQGHVAGRAIGKDEITYVYGTANHCSGQLLQDVSTGSIEQVRTIQYDGYGRANLVVVTDSQTSEMLLSSQYEYNPQCRLQTIKMSSSAPRSGLLNCTKSFTYDGLGQLISAITVYTDGSTSKEAYTYDGNCNLLSSTIDEVTETRNYNVLGQRTDSGFRYDTNGRLLTDNKGRSFSYSSDDRLQSVNGVKFSYHPDGSLASSADSAAQTRTQFFYDNGTVNTINTGNDSTSYQLEPGRRIASYDRATDKSMSYVHSNGSTVLVSDPGANAATAIADYHAYGSPRATSNQDSHFGYRQEYTEPNSGLVYLRSRFYVPDQAAFLTMDGAKKENRYAYCGADPINRSDATGHSGAGVMAAAMTASIATTVLLGIATGGLAVAVFGPEAISASMAAAAVSGAAGNVVGDAVGGAAAHEKVNGSTLALDAVSGAVGGAFGAGSGGAAGRLAMEIAESSVQSVKSIGVIGMAVSGSVGGATGSFTSGLVESVGKDQPLFSAHNALSFVTGLFGGLGGGVLGSMSLLPFGRLNILPVMATRNDFGDMHINTFDEEINMASPNSNPKVLKSFVTASEHQNDLDGFDLRTGDRNNVLRKAHNNGQTFDTFTVHGQGMDVFPAMRRTVNGVPSVVLRPMKGAVFAEKLALMQSHGDFGNGDIKALSCHAALFNAQYVANALRCNVFGSYRAISGQEPSITWRTRFPS